MHSAVAKIVTIALLSSWLLIGCTKATSQPLGFYQIAQPKVDMVQNDYGDGKAVQLSFQALQVSWKTLGWKHPITCIRIYNLAVVIIIPLILVFLLIQECFISLRIHSIMPLLQSVMTVLLIILINRSRLEGRLWAKGKYKLSQRKSRKSA